MFEEITGPYLAQLDIYHTIQNDRMALPPPPNPRDQSEVPTKPLGPILTRSMLDIRSDIAEVYSRCSRANCEFLFNETQSFEFI